jgi:hypothetical protein
VRKNILTIRAGECRYPVTDEPPHLFCSDPTEGIYCDYHSTLCHVGPGKDIAAVEEMIYGVDKSVSRRRPVVDVPHNQPVDRVVK